MTATILQFAPRPKTLNLDEAVELYTVEQLIAQERSLHDSDGNSKRRRALVEKLLRREG